MSPEQSRRVALGLLFAAIALAIAAVGVPAWMLHRHYNAALEDDLGKLERYRRIAGTRPDVSRQLEAMRAKDTRRFFLRSGAAALSAADAGERIRTIVESNGGKLITMQPPVTRDEGRYRMVSVNVQMTANIMALRQILDAIDASTPLLFVDNVMVRSQVPGSFRPQPGQEPEMFVQFDLYGYSLVAAS